MIAISIIFAKVTTLVVFLLATTSTCIAQPDSTKSAGFREFRLGMNATNIRSLVDTTLFTILTSDSIWTDSWSGEFEINAKTTEIESAKKAAYRMGCDPDWPTRCQAFSSLTLYFFRGILYRITVGSNWHRAKDAIIGWGWCDVATKVISLRYGGPQRSSKYLENLRSEMYPYMKSGIYTFAGWDLSSALVSTEQTIRVVYYMSSGEQRKVHCNIEIVDVDLNAQNRAEINELEEANQ